MTIINLGWRQFFQAQLQDGDAAYAPVRVLAVYRGRVDILGEDIEASVPLTGKAADMDITVGDWLLVDVAGPTVKRRLERFGLFQRRAAGTAVAARLLRR